MKWGISTESNSFRYGGYFIMYSAGIGSSWGWKFIPSFYSSYWKTQSSLSAQLVKDRRYDSYVTVSLPIGNINSRYTYCLGVGYSTYEGQNSIVQDGRPKRIDGTDINMNDSDMFCGEVIQNYIPCKAQNSDLQLRFGNVALTVFDSAEAKTTLTMDCFINQGFTNSNAKLFRIRLAGNANAIPLGNGLVANIALNGETLSSTKGYELPYRPGIHTILVVATLSGTPTKTGEFTGNSYLIMEYL